MTTPVALHHPAFMKTLKIKERSRTDDTRALRILLDWCAARDVPPFLERIDVKTAVRFMDELQEFTELGWASATKYLGRLRRYWAYLVMRTPVDRNPFEGLHLEKPAVEHGEEERAFTDTEVQRLLMGKADPGMLDVMLVAASTGARLDAVIDLRVRRWFITKAERAAVDGDLLAAIVGHKRSGLTLGRYSEGPEMTAAKVAVSKVRLPPLDGSLITEAQALTPRRRRSNV